MFGSETILIDSFDVSFSTVTDVFVKTVFWVFFGEFDHVIVTGDFGDDGGGGNFTDFTVAFDAGGSVFF